MADSKFAKNPEEKQRFPDLTDADLKLLIDGSKSENTKKGTKTALKGFNDYLRSKNIAQDETEISNELLPEILATFYASMRKMLRPATRIHP